MGNIVIRNCSRPGQCPGDWGALVSTADDRVRYCSSCDRGVHLCETEAQLQEALAANQTVAMSVNEGGREKKGPDEDLWEMDDTYFDQ